MWATRYRGREGSRNSATVLIDLVKWFPYDFDDSLNAYREQDLDGFKLIHIGRVIGSP